jgi:hypothetical protein
MVLLFKTIKGLEIQIEIETSKYVPIQPKGWYKPDEKLTSLCIKTAKETYKLFKKNWKTYDDRIRIQDRLNSINTGNRNLKL